MVSVLNSCLLLSTTNTILSVKTVLLCVNDITLQVLSPLLPWLRSNCKMNPAKLEQVVAESCWRLCALVQPLLVVKLLKCLVCMVKPRLWFGRFAVSQKISNHRRSKVAEGDVFFLDCFPSGIHSNGYSPASCLFVDYTGEEVLSRTWRQNLKTFFFEPTVSTSKQPCHHKRRIS